MNGKNNATIEQWGIFELALEGSADGNPFLDTRFTTKIIDHHATIEVDDVTDGGCILTLCFMPVTTGTWTYTTSSNLESPAKKEGSFEVGQPSKRNHGPVRVANTYHF